MIVGFFSYEQLLSFNAEKTEKTAKKGSTKAKKTQSNEQTPEKEPPVYDRHKKHWDKQPYERVMNSTVPEFCPELLQPHDIHFMVLNMDRSVNRLARMRKQFEDLGLPQFQRIPGVQVVKGQDYGIPQRGRKDVHRV